jgi:hypothetical protein
MSEPERNGTRLTVALICLLATREDAPKSNCNTNNKPDLLASATVEVRDEKAAAKTVEERPFIDPGGHSNERYGWAGCPLARCDKTTWEGLIPYFNNSDRFDKDEGWRKGIK